MHFRFPLLLTGIISLMIPIQALALESCDSQKKNSGIESRMEDRGLEIISTQIIKVDSPLKEDYIKSLFKAESAARIEMMRWMKSICNNEECFHPEKIIDPSDLDAQLSMMVTISKCHINNKYVQVSVEFSPETIKLAK